MAATTVAVAGYLGMLFQSGKRPNTFLRMMGGIQGKVLTTKSREFPVNVLYQLRTPAQPANLEGAVAPAAQTRTVTQATNVVQIHHEKISLTYLAEGDETVSGVVPIPQGSVQSDFVNPRSMEFQSMTAMQTIQQDVNFSFLQGTYANPADPSGTALKTRGILSAISTNILNKTADTGVTAAMYRAYIEDLVLATMITNGYVPDETWTLFCDANQYRNAQRAYYGLTTPPYERDIAGLQIRVLYTNVGVVNLVLDPDMPANTLLLTDMSVVAPVGLVTPGKGIIFQEALAKVGSSDDEQIYATLGLDHGPEFCHGRVNLASNIALSA